MTREEAIKTLKENYCAMCAYGSHDMDSCDIRSCDNKDAIKALEQEPFMNKPCVAHHVCHEDKVKVLDKIRAEITDWQTDIHDNEYDAETHDFVFERIYEIIDKYKESEE